MFIYITIVNPFNICLFEGIGGIYKLAKTEFCILNELQYTDYGPLAMEKDLNPFFGLDAKGLLEYTILLKLKYNRFNYICRSPRNSNIFQCSMAEEFC